MAFDALNTLKDAQQPIGELSSEQRELLESLTPAEVAILNQLKDDLEFAPGDDAAPPHVGNIIL